MYVITISCLFSYILYGTLYTVLLSVVLLLAYVCLTVWMTMKVHELRSWKGPLLLCVSSWLTMWMLMAQVDRQVHGKCETQKIHFHRKTMGSKKRIKRFNGQPSIHTLVLDSIKPGLVQNY